MTQRGWDEAKRVFQAALDHPPAQREEFVRSQCQDDSLCAEVLRLLRLHDDPSQFLDSPIGAAPPLQADADPLVGRDLGSFCIVRRIGTGGMGTVYEAQQEHPRRRAAVKVLRPELATPAMLRRFAYESEVLAKLHHPGIAHVYAAGTIESHDGARPWFAMELIEGVPLHQYVSTGSQPARHKLNLLARVCDAVQHAHQRGVVHRDLKPANILVGDDGLPKILDFGVARLLDVELQATMHTRMGELVGTVGYMSPEQLSGNPDDIDARCDVFALGVIGYELLGGRLPHPARGHGVTDVLRAISQDEPRRLGLIDPALRGDVESIIAKALEKDKTRRYQSAAELADDIRRYLNDQPVMARPATGFYQFRKFARRHRAIVAGVAATMASLLAGIVMVAYQARHARREAARSQYEADKATAINNFITNDFLMNLLATGDGPDGARPKGVAQLVDRAAARIDVMFADQPLAEAAIRNEIATIYYNLGAFEQAAQHFRQALNRWEAHLGPDHEDTLKAVNNLGQTMARLHRYEEAEMLYRRALEGRLRILGANNSYTLASMNNLGNLLRLTGRFAEAEALLRRAIDGQKYDHGPARKTTLITRANLGTLLALRGQVSEALHIHRDVYKTCRATLGPDHATTLMVATRLGQTLIPAGRPSEAESLMRGVLEACEQMLGPDHSDTIEARRTLGRAVGMLDRKEEAAEILRQALRSASSQPGMDDVAREIQAERDRLLGP